MRFIKLCLLSIIAHGSAFAYGNNETIVVKQSKVSRLWNSRSFSFELCDANKENCRSMGHKNEYSFEALHKQTVPKYTRIFSSGLANMGYLLGAGGYVTYQFVSKKDDRGNIRSIDYLFAEADKFLFKNLGYNSSFAEKNPELTYRPFFRFNIDRSGNIANDIRNLALMAGNTAEEIMLDNGNSGDKEGLKMQRFASKVWLGTLVFVPMWIIPTIGGKVIDRIINKVKPDHLGETRQLLHKMLSNRTTEADWHVDSMTSKQLEVLLQNS